MIRWLEPNALNKQWKGLLMIDPARRQVSMDEALLVMRGWESLLKPVRFQLSLPFISPSILGRIIFLSDDEVRIAADGNESRPEASFFFRRGFEVWYSDPRNFPQDAKTFVCGLSFEIPNSSQSSPDRVVLEEVLGPE